MATYMAQAWHQLLMWLNRQVAALWRTVNGVIPHLLLLLLSLPLLLVRISKGKSKGIAVCETAPHRYGKSLTNVITQCYLLPGRGDAPAFTPAEAGTRFSDPEGMQG